MPTPPFSAYRADDTGLPVLQLTVQPRPPGSDWAGASVRRGEGVARGKAVLETESGLRALACLMSPVYTVFPSLCPAFCKVSVRKARPYLSSWLSPGLLEKCQNTVGVCWVFVR